MDNSHKQIQTSIKTNNDANFEILTEKNKKKIAKIKNDEIKNNEIKNNETPIVPRYGTTVDLKNNKVIDKLDRYTTRDKNLPSAATKQKISRICIDSSNRIIDPKNIILKYITINTPFIFTEKSNILHIKMPLDHGIKVDSNITITNVQPTTVILRGSSLQLTKNSNYIKINHPNHGFIGDNNYINISGVVNYDTNNDFFGNVPLTLINGDHKIILIKNNGVLDYNNYNIDIGIYSDNNYVYIGDSFTINIMSFNGIHLKYINASYPITDEIQQGYHTIIETGNDYTKIKLSSTSSKSSINFEGNENILIGLISSITDGYAEPNYYKYELKKTYYNVKKIKLVSSEFPNTELLIKEAPDEQKNNSLYLQILDDGDYIYTININPGNYDSQSLQSELVNKISKLKRNFGSYLTSSNYSQYLIPSITINPFTNLFSMSILSIVSLSKCVNISTQTYDDDNIRIIITHPYHNLNSGNRVILDNVINIEDPSSTENNKLYIPSHIINTEHEIESIGGLNSYVIRLEKYNPQTTPPSDTNATFGGNAIKITHPLTIRLLFNYLDTIGNILGFLNVGSETSITIYDKIITNRSTYFNSSNLNSVGLVSYNTPMLNFRTYPYIYMVSEIFSSNINLKDSVGIFAKLFLTGNPGSFIYDQYIQVTEEVPQTFAYLNYIEFKFLTPDGKTYNFNGQNHSYTLELYEEIDEADK
jgi:hypothetical protein